MYVYVQVFSKHLESFQADAVRRKDMNSIEFGKKCRPYNVKYREIFGYVPCRDDYLCNQEDYFSALMQAIELEKELTEFIPKKKIDYVNTEKKY